MVTSQDINMLKEGIIPPTASILIYDIGNAILYNGLHKHNTASVEIFINPAKPEYRNMCPKNFFYLYLR